jgi:hypothetical protein
MKKFILLLTIASIGCKKSPKSNFKVVSYTFQLVWAKMDIQYEKKYGILHYAEDTLIFHSDNSITEILGQSTFATSITFNTHPSALDTFVHNPGDPPNHYNENLYITYPKILDTSSFGGTFYYALTHDTLDIQPPIDTILYFQGPPQEFAIHL